MNIHQNARTTPQSRALLVHRVLEEHWSVSSVAVAFGISERTVYKWLARYRAHGIAGLQDRRSVARRRPHALSGLWLALIRLLRHAKLVAAEIAARSRSSDSACSLSSASAAWSCSSRCVMSCSKSRDCSCRSWSTARLAAASSVFNCSRV